MKKQIIFGLGLTLLVSCSSHTSTGSNSNCIGDIAWTISFEADGGSTIAPLSVKNGEKASKPLNPTKAGYVFNQWCVDSYLTVAFDWDSPITSDWILYASWAVDASYVSSSDSESIDSSTESNSTAQNGHGPTGSTLTSWYLVGEGSLWGDDGWTKAGGVQLYNNPSNKTDKGCILGLTLEVGDKFKVTDGGSTWFGYEKVDSSSSSSNRGTTNFKGESDGCGGENFKCTIAGTYDMYINSSGVLWIQDSVN